MAVEEVIVAWQEYLSGLEDWQALVAGIDPKQGGCGLVYEIPNPIPRPGESFAIADMRELELSEPHKHINGETEIYITIQGMGRVVVGTSVHELSPGIAVATPPDTMHCTRPVGGLVLAVINTPPFNADNYVPLGKHDETVAQALMALHA